MQNPCKWWKSHYHQTRLNTERKKKQQQQQTQQNSQLTKHLPVCSHQAATCEHQDKHDAAATPDYTSVPGRTWSGCLHSRPPAHGPVVSLVNLHIYMWAACNNLNWHPLAEGLPFGLTSSKTRPCNWPSAWGALSRISENLSNTPFNSLQQITS